MTKADTVRIMAILRSAYPNFYRNQSREDVEAAIRLWADLFADDDPNVVAAAVKAHIAICDSDFPPVIGQIKRQVYRLTHADLTEADAWRLVLRHLHDEWETPWESLPPLVQRAVGGRDGMTALSCMEYQQRDTVGASNFMRCYRTLLEQQLETEMLPAAVRAMIPEAPEIEGRRIMRLIEGA